MHVLQAAYLRRTPRKQGTLLPKRVLSETRATNGAFQIQYNVNEGERRRTKMPALQPKRLVQYKIGCSELRDLGHDVPFLRGRGASLG